MSVLKIKDNQGNWKGISTIKGDTGNGISSAVLNDDYTLTLTFTDGTTYTTPSIRGEQGPQGDPATSMDIHICSITEYDSITKVPTIENPNNKTFYLVPNEDGTSPDLFVEWVYVNNAWEMFGSANIDLSNYVTNTDYATANDGGVVRVNGYGLKINASNGIIQTSGATSGIIKSATGSDAEYHPVTPLRQHESTFYGLAKASGDTTQSQSDNAVGTYTDDAKASIQSMLGVPSTDDVVTDVQVNGTSITADGVANLPIATKDNLGVIKRKLYSGVVIDADGSLRLEFAGDTTIKNGVSTYTPIVPQHQHKSVFYGLAKAAGYDEKDSTLSIGQYTPEAKGAIQSMLDVPSKSDIPVVNVDDVQIDGTSILSDGVANVPIASSQIYGAVKLGVGLKTESNTLVLDGATTTHIKSGANRFRAITPTTQDASAFYGLAKAAGDTTQSASSNEVGTYTDEAKTSIKQMLGVVDSYDSLVVNVTGTDPVITGSPSYRYNCGEVASLTVTPPTSGTIDIIFTSGTTPTVLDLPQTVKMPSWWIGVEANTTYEMCITDGVYCGVMSWDA